MQNLPPSHGDLTGANYIPWQPGDTDLSYAPTSPWKCQPPGEVMTSQLEGCILKQYRIQNRSASGVKEVSGAKVVCGEWGDEKKEMMRE